MAAGSSGGSKASALEASLDRKLQSVTNTMESIQSLSGWCIENKKHHHTIVHQWLRWFRRSAFTHRLNLFYLANDIIQNCKRKNAIIYRDTFADVLPEAASLVKDQSVSKSVERVFKIWEDRNVYHEDTIAAFRTALNGGGWSKRERSKSSRPKPAEKPPEAPPVNPKAALKSKIVAEFRPQSLIDDLLSFKRSVGHVELKEKQLSNMRVDVCSTETLKRLKDKAGGKKFSKDFEEASAKLEEFVNILDKQVKNGPSLTEALENAGIFFEAQYREVKVVVNAYKTFANRVSNLKKKLDQLKATLPDPEESPVPSPTTDAPSPTGSESPFQGMGDESPLSPETELVQPDSPEPPKDNRIVEDMELSDVDADEEMPEIIIEERKEQVEPASTVKDTVISPASTPPDEATASVPTPIAAPSPSPCPSPSPAPVSTSASAPPLPSTMTTATTVPVTTASTKTVTTPATPPSGPLALPNLANVDLGKISSILSSLTSVMKTGVSPAGKPSPGTPTTPTTTLSGAVKTPVQSTSNPLANLLSKVEITPESILSVLSRTQVPSASNLQGLSSLIQSVAASSALQSGSATLSTSTAPLNTTVQTVKDRNTPSVTPPFLPKSYGYSPTNSNRNISSTSVCKPAAPPSSNVKQTGNPAGFAAQSNISTEKLVNQSAEMPKSADETEPSSLEMKIHNFLKGNPGFSGLDLNIPILSGLGATAAPDTTSEFLSGPTSTSLDNVDGTPVRDERSGTPTQDEMMDKQTAGNVDSVSLLSKIISSGSSTPSNSRSPLLNKDNEFQMHLSLPSSYRPFGVDGSSPNAYRQSSDTMEKPSVVDSSLDTFFPDTSFQDEDYRDFEFSGHPAAALGNLDKRPSKTVLKPNVRLDPMEYPPITQSFSQPQDFNRQSFPHSIKPPFISGENSGQLTPSSDMYGGYNLRGNNLEGSGSSSPPKNEQFYPSDTNHNLALLHSVMPPQTQYSDSSHVPQNRHPNFHPKNNNPTRTSVDQSASTISASTAMEFKNMLKNASLRTSENSFSQASVNEDSHISRLGHTGLTPEDRSEEQYRIETRVSSSCVDLSDSTEEKGAPIETLGYHNAGNVRISGEPIKTVESMRVGMKGGRGHGIDGGRSGWFEMGSAGSSFDDGPPSVDKQSSVSSGGAGFNTQYEEHLPRFPDTVNDFRAKNIPSFDPHLPPPSMVSPMDRGVPFPMDQTVLPPCPPPGLPPDHGNLFPSDMPIPSHIAPVEPPKNLPHIAHPPPTDHGGNPFTVHHSAEHGGIPFSPPPHLDMRNPFSQDHGAVHQGAMNEPFTMHQGPTREHEPFPRDHNSQHNQTLGRINEPVAHNPRDHHRGFSGPPHHFAPHHRDLMNTGGLRTPRPHFRPREPYHNLKRPRPPFGRGPQFFPPKRPYFPPRY
ncbi:regulation of nuclear pre-mRNA domain-containing protein 2 [Pseudophryne corroboree]|uniref:regulation of nuclear pre-mRNA domain-containing protein 2 n=1 Tax=Pseudophryne corroboree TaxID=495146 RepID=UPI0030813C4A